VLHALRPKLTFANVMVVLLTFIVLGGGAYAATKLPKNSVGTKQLRKGAVTRAKISKATRKALRGARGQAGPTGPAGPAATPGATIPVGVTLRGAAVASTSNPVPGENGDANGISFGGFQTPSRPIAHIVPVGGASTAVCPGSASQPEAASGNLCVYVVFSSPSKGAIGVSDPGVFEPPSGANYSFETSKAGVLGDGTVARFGFTLGVSGYEGVAARVYGTWAVTG
jgi:hypothetical protein